MERQFDADRDTAIAVRAEKLMQKDGLIHSLALTDRRKAYIQALRQADRELREEENAPKAATLPFETFYDCDETATLFGDARRMIALGDTKGAAKLMQRPGLWKTEEHGIMSGNLLAVTWHLVPEDRKWKDDKRPLNVPR